MEAYLLSTANISPQDTFDDNNFLNHPISFSTPYLSSLEPDYKSYIDPKSSRRMGRILKMGVMAANRCLSLADVRMPDAIITGTGFGCLEDTENFLCRILDNDEQFLTPTTFIQSTHNTISAQIALLLHCHAYNFTYVHRGFSFESALLDALMLIAETPKKNVLVGGIDEITPNFFTITERVGQWKKEKIDNLKLLEHQTAGSIAGEGSAFFVLSGEKKNAVCKIISISNLYKPKDVSDVNSFVEVFLSNAGLSANDLSLVILGNNGDREGDGIYNELQRNIFSGNNQAYFKHLCGEYQTASAFGLWLASKILRHQEVPAIIRLNKYDGRPLKHILLYNHYRNKNHSLLLLEAC